MGLDTVEMVFAIEKHFQIEIPNEVAAKLTTVGDMHEYVYSELHRLGRRTYGYTQVFDELRQIIVEQAGVDPRLVQPDASFVYDLKMD